MSTRIILVTVLMFAGASARSEVKVAVVPGGDPKPNELLVLTEAKLFENQEIAMLERTEIEKVLAEQKLSGLFDAASAVKLGQILKADIFAVLETASIVIFDAHTGLRFVDETLPEKLDDAVQAAADAVKTAVENRQKLAEGKLVTFGILGVRNIDLPVTRDAWCRAVAGLLERSLQHRGGAVLERSRLQHVNKERQLTGDAENALLASMKLIDLDFQRVENLQSFKLIAQVGKETFSAEGSLDKPLDVVHKIAERLLESKNVTEIDRQAEAARFAAEARILENIGTADEVIEKYESAIALDPENLNHRLHYYVWLIRRVDARLNHWDGLNGFDSAWQNNPINAEQMRDMVHDMFRLDALLTTFPPLQYDDLRFLPHQDSFFFSYHIFDEIRFKLTALAKYHHPEFLAEVRTLNRRTLDRWMNSRYRASLNNVVDEATFENYFREMMSGPPKFQEIADLAAPYAEIIENTLRLAQKYEMSPEMKQNWKGWTWNFENVFLAFHAEGNVNTSPSAAAKFERVLALLEQDARFLSPMQALIMRNKPVAAKPSSMWDHQTFTLSTDSTQLKTYRNKLKTYLAALPKEMLGEMCYSELLEILTTEHRGQKVAPNSLSVSPRLEVFDYIFPKPNVFHQLAEIITLADSRDEYHENTVMLYICLAVMALDETIPGEGKDEYLKLKEQFDPVVRRQLALMERYYASEDARIHSVNPAKDMENIRKNAIAAGIIHPPKTETQAESPKIAEVRRPWTSEVNLFPKEEGYRPWDTPTIRGNLLFSPLFVLKPRDGENDRCLGCVNLETLEKRYIPLPTRKWFHSNVTHIDNENVYFTTYNASETLGLLVYPLDGSEPWTLSTDDGLPDNWVHIMGRLGDYCYARVGIDWIVRINVKTRQWEQLSSSRAKEGKTPFVNGKQLRGYNTIYDSKRERILLQDTTDGLWAKERFWMIEKDGTFAPLKYGNPSHYTKDMIRCGDKLFERLGDEVQVVQFKSTNGEKYVYDSATSTLFPTSYEEFWMYNCCVWNGYLWGGAGRNWGRQRIDIVDPEYERLSKPEVATPFDDPPGWY
ncbi:MAG: CsgG/HfaB family protein, partial [Planctomycetaceae bacterium]|nr:CsgG/HfaB family protein [Planctomycetaceae bacterium]